MNSHYFTHHLLGAWMLLRGNEEGFDHFDLTEGGFWRSFIAMALAMPYYIIVLSTTHGIQVEAAAQNADYDFAVPFAAYLMVPIVFKYVEWVAYLGAMGPLSRAFRAGSRFLNFVIAYNWAAVLIMVLTLPLYLAQKSGVLSLEIFLIIGVMLSFVFLIYSWFITCLALKVSKLDAAALVAVEIAMVLIGERVASTILGAFQPDIAPM